MRNSTKPLENTCLSLLDQHKIYQNMVSKGSVKTINILHNAGFEAYIVGGGIRDLLLNKKPKDFDIATNATPDQIIKLFKRSRKVGRRFQIVHIYFKNELIEVTTFRGNTQNSKNQIKNSYGMLLKDNVFGMIEDDAIRRDFTINALYYEPNSNTIRDFVDGYSDLKNKLIRVIGVPEVRFREDPVRMLRAVRFAAKLHFNIELQTGSCIENLSSLVSCVSSFRLFDEVLKLLQNGYGLTTFDFLRSYGLFEYLFPKTEMCLDDRYLKFLQNSLKNTDIRIQNSQTTNPAFLYATLLWPSVISQKNKLLKSGKSKKSALMLACRDTLENNQKHVSIPKRFLTTTREIWEFQIKLEKKSEIVASKLTLHPRFRASYDFLLLRELVGECDTELVKWWANRQNITFQRLKLNK